MEFVLKKCFDDPKISFGSVLRSMLRNVLAWPSPVSTQAYLSTVVKLHPRQGGVDVDHWNPGQELRNWWSLPIWTLTKHWPPSTEWPYVVWVCGLAETTSCCTFWARNNETLKQKKSASRSEFKSPLVIESRKSVAAAGSQQNAKSHYKRKWKGCGSKGKGGPWCWLEGKSTPKAHVTRGPQAHTLEQTLTTAATVGPQKALPFWNPPPISPPPF